MRLALFRALSKIENDIKGILLNFVLEYQDKKIAGTAEQRDEIIDRATDAFYDLLAQQKARVEKKVVSTRPSQCNDCFDGEHIQCIGKKGGCECKCIKMRARNARAIKKGD